MNKPVVYGTTSTSLVVELMNQSCMNCGLQWLHHAIGRFDLNNSTLQMACLDMQQPTVIVRTPAIEPQPPAALDAPTLQLLRPYQKMIEPRRNRQ